MDEAQEFFARQELHEGYQALFDGRDPLAQRPSLSELLQLASERFLACVRELRSPIDYAEYNRELTQAFNRLELGVEKTSAWQA